MRSRFFVSFLIPLGLAASARAEPQAATAASSAAPGSAAAPATTAPPAASGAPGAAPVAPAPASASVPPPAAPPSYGYPPPGGEPPPPYYGGPQPIYVGPPPGYGPPPPGWPAPPPREDPHAHKHDGFYLRFGLGPGYGRVTSSGSLSGYSVDTTYKGWGASYELMLGGTLGDSGVVIGGGFVGQAISDPSSSGNAVVTDSSGNVVFADSSGSGAAMVAVGPFVDWFPDNRGGAHLGAMLGFGAVAMPTDGSDSSDAGIGVSAWAGYDFWIANQWSLGAEARAAYATSKRHFLDGDIEDKATSLELLFTALYH